MIWTARTQCFYSNKKRDPFFNIFLRSGCILQYYRTLAQASFSKTLMRVPIWGLILTSNLSPSRSLTLGVFPAPTPAGVPVMMTVPAGNVVPCDKKLTSLGTLKMRSLRYWSVHWSMSWMEDSRGSLNSTLLYYFFILCTLDLQFPRVRNELLGGNRRTWQSYFSSGIPMKRYSSL